MKNRWLFPLLLISLIGCNANSTKDVLIDASCIAKSVGGETVKGFMIHNFSFLYTGVTADDNNNFVIEKDGYIESDASIPYSYMRLSTDKLSVTVCNMGYVEEIYTYVDVTLIDYKKSLDKFTFDLKGWQKVRITNNTEQNIVLSPIYFCSETE